MWGFVHRSQDAVNHRPEVSLDLREMIVQKCLESQARVVGVWRGLHSGTPSKAFLVLPPPLLLGSSEPAARRFPLSSLGSGTER